MNNVNQITNAGTLKLQHAQSALQTRANTGSQVQFAEILQNQTNKAQSVQFSTESAAEGD